ncbi:hypothetical protein CI109_106034 [Kwoniella shandongensis]|uniref:Uncharacterized protein n=1 Tax=Kwoniella shandongensis TaxID=1734106 RepID=A0A5M6BXR6_9TREE|nr:uncharacterized protein CI109_003917 [Kwoniella shandongensis]KAA5527658.1 hypothetical protein CI109_003917 [Kwoniella shandongensis]
MPPRRPLKRRGEEDDRSPARQPKRAGKNKREQTYDTYDEALDGGVEMEEKGERYRDGDKAQRFFERAIELYSKALGFQETYDAAYNQARALYTLSTNFLLPPASLDPLRKSIDLYRRATTLTNSPLLRMDVGFNLSQSCSSLADVLEDLDPDSEEIKAEVRKLREEARDVLQEVMDGQEEYLRATGEETEVALAEEEVIEEGSTEGEAGEQEQGMEVDSESKDEQEDGHESATFETYLPTPSAFIDTVIALIDLHLSLWDSTPVPQTPTEEEQAVVRNILDRAATLAPPGRQAELDLTEIKVLLAMDSIVWDLFKSQAQVGMGLERSLEGAVAAIGAVLASLDVAPPQDENTVRADVLTTLADTHSVIASRMLFLNVQLPPGPSPLAQQAWYHLSQATTHLTAAVELPTSLANTPREFKPSVLLSLSKLSLSRARLAPVNQTAQRNVVQLMENATTYAARAGEGLGWKFLRIDSAPPAPTSGTLSLSIGGAAGGSSSSLPYQAGWDSESLGRTIAFQQIRVCLYASRTDLLSEDLRKKYAEGLEKVVKGLKAITGDERKVGARDLKRWLGDLEDDEGGVLDIEKTWWDQVFA